jgi:hypothetical protein
MSDADVANACRWLVNLAARRLVSGQDAKQVSDHPAGLHPNF